MEVEGGVESANGRSAEVTGGRAGRGDSFCGTEAAHGRAGCEGLPTCGATASSCWTLCNASPEPRHVEITTVSRDICKQRNSDSDGRARMTATRPAANRQAEHGD